MKVTIQIVQATLDRAPEAEAAVCGVAQDERPLRGPAGHADWRMCGLLSQQLLEQKYEGDAGEDLLTSTQGRLPFERLFLIGLGRTPKLDPAVARKLATRAGHVAVRAGVATLTVPLWDLTRERIEFPEALNAFLLGAGRALAQGAPVEALTLQLLARNPSEAGRMKHDLVRIAKKPPVDGMELDVPGAQG